MDRKSLEAQLVSVEQEMETAKANVYRCDGVKQFLTHLIASLPPDAPIDVEDLTAAE